MSLSFFSFFFQVLWTKALVSLRESEAQFFARYCRTWRDTVKQKFVIKIIKSFIYGSQRLCQGEVLARFHK